MAGGSAGLALGALGSTVGVGSAGASGAPREQRGSAGQAGSSRQLFADDDRFPIGMWWPPHPFESTDARYAEIAEAGFTFVIAGNYVADTAINRWAMTAASKAGLGFVAGEPNLSTMPHQFDAGGDTAQPFMLTDEEVREGVRLALESYASTPGFSGISLYDEPSAEKFTTLRAYVDAVRELGPDVLPYINLFPTNDVTYVRGFVEAVRPPFVSFDRYPLLLDGDDPGWFDNLQIVRTVGLEAGIPYWTFIQSIKYANHRMPTPAELRWQIGIALAYGYGGIQYFTYWQPDPARGEAFEPALLTVDGERTELWHAAKRINPDVQTAWQSLRTTTSQSVSVTNLANPPTGLPAFTPDEWIVDATGSAVVVGQFATADAPNQRVLVVTNFSHDDPADATLTFGDGVTPTEQRIQLPAGGFRTVVLTRL